MKKLFTILLVLITSIGYSQTIDTVRIPIGGFGGSTDTTSLSNRINSKLAIADTAGMLANYQNQINTNTSHIATNTSNIASNTSAIAGKENSLGNPSTNGYVLSSTTAGARSWVPNGSGSSGTVTSVGSGYGITGGAITTSGTLTLDSATVSNYYVRRKDSTNSFVTPTQSALKADDNAVVHLAGTETITGAKTFATDIGVDADNTRSFGASFKGFKTIFVNNLFRTNSAFPLSIGQNGTAYLTFAATNGYVTFNRPVTLPAGTATAGTAPLKFTSGTNLTTPENGAVEYDGSHLYFTIGSTRYQLDQPLYSSLSGTPPTWNQNTTGTAANLSGTPVLNNGITATTQTTTDSSKLIATTEFVKTAPIKAVQITGRLDTSQMKPVFINLKDPLQLNATKDTMIMRTAYFDSLYSGAKTLQDVTDSGSITTNTITAANLNLTNIQEFTNQHAAILGGLSNGDVFRLPADGNGNHLLAIVDSTAAGLTFTVDNTSGTYATNSLYFQASSTFTMRINWGDGTVDDYSGATSYDIHHTYATSDTFNVTITSGNYGAITYIHLNHDGTNDENIRNLKDFSLFTALYELDIHRIHLTDINSITLPNSINNFTCGSNDFTNFNRSLPSSMVVFSMSFTTCSSFTATNYPNTIKTFFTNSNSLTTTDVNNILVGLNTAGVTGATINTSGNSAPPSGAGATAKANLISAGNTVTTD